MEENKQPAPCNPKPDDAIILTTPAAPAPKEKPIWLQEPKNPFLRAVWLATHDYGFNWIQAITGTPGVGKSYCALKMAEILDPHFSINKMCFDPEEFIAAVDAIKRDGEVVIMDETSVILNSRRWQSITSMILNHVLVTCRYKHPIIFLVTPDMTYIDSQARKVIAMFSEVKRHSRNAPVMWLYTLSYDRKTGKAYFPHPLLRLGGGKVARLSSVTFNEKPSPALVEAYERKATAWKDRLRRRGYKTLEALAEDDGERKFVPVNLDQMVDEIAATSQEFFNARNFIDSNLIRIRYNISTNNARLVKALVEKRLGLMPGAIGKGIYKDRPPT